jgi:hypothetical protein
MLVWLSLAIAAVAVVASAAFVVVRGLGAYRQLKRTARALSWGLERVATGAAAAEQKAAALADGTERLETALTRLSASRSRLDVLLRAWSDVSSTWGAARSYVPREKKA